VVASGFFEALAVVVDWTGMLDPSFRFWLTELDLRRISKAIEPHVRRELPTASIEMANNDRAIAIHLFTCPLAPRTRSFSFVPKTITVRQPGALLATQTTIALTAAKATAIRIRSTVAPLQSSVTAATQHRFVIRSAESAWNDV
jgi:hypothetical protein